MLMQQSEIEKLVEAWVRAVESGVPGAFETLVAGDVTDIEARARAFHTAFAGVSVTVDELLTEGDGVAWRFTLRGEHRGPCMGIARTGRRVAISGVNFQRVTDGRVREHWTLLDRYELLQQLRAP
jgi:predicted ester cyclase